MMMSGRGNVAEREQCPWRSLHKHPKTWQRDEESKGPEESSPCRVVVEHSVKLRKVLAGLHRKLVSLVVFN